jgi:ABC-2 type transport system ATP-binding protein
VAAGWSFDPAGRYGARAKEVPTAVIEIEGLRKEFRRLRGGPTVAVDGLDLVVPEGGVFGFLGPNGAGKTTTIRCLLGLVRPNAGRSVLLGQDTGRDLAKVIDRVGSIVEAPAFFPRFTGKRSLELLAGVVGIGRKTVDEALERVGLAPRANDLVKTYSLGMKQRLGIAAALLKDPALLILDEPANGLDPAGIKEVRDLLRQLGNEGRTVFVSSHQLAEVQQMCDRVSILSRGRCIAGGSVEEVLARGRHDRLIVKLADLSAGLAALREAGIQATTDTDHLQVDLPIAEAARVTEVLARQRLFLSELRPEQVSLETVFLELTQDAPRGERAS